MRLSQLSIASFKNLDRFSIDFDDQSAITVLVGRNGTGKSNLLEALTLIFRDLDLGNPPPFAYQLQYTCRGHRVDVDADPSRKTHRVRVKVDETPMSLQEFIRPTHDRYLPTYVFGYYSGPSNRMESHYLAHQERFYKELVSGADQPLRPLFYARPVHSQFVLLAFFIEQDQRALEFLDKELNIEALETVLFIMRQPPWNSREGDPRFWNARGAVGVLLDKLYGLALAPLRIDQRVNVGFRKTTTREHLYLYLKDLNTIRSLAGTYPNQQEFFKALESTYISELISEVRIRVRSRNIDGSLTFRELSEGEQQLLMVLGLLRFTSSEESLFLLDEPDTHLNPAWSVQYTEFLRAYGGTQDNSHIVMATHDPLVVAGLVRSQVQILQREDTGEISTQMPSEDPRGMGVGALLTSEVYGLRSQLDLVTLNRLDRKRELAVKEDLSEPEKAELRDLDQELAGLDFTISVRDPLYEEYVKAKTVVEREEGLQTPVLDADQQEKQKKLALEIMRELIRREDRQS
jgi:predicted ATPase